MNCEIFVKKFEDGSILKVPKLWIECATIKYGISWSEYFKLIEKKIDELWHKKMVITKFGKMTFEEYESLYGEKIRNRSEHAKIIIYTDLRCCILARLLKMFCKDVKVVGIDKNSINIYDNTVCFHIKK